MEFQAALALCQVKKADWIKQRRLENVHYLNLGLRGMGFELPVFNKDVSYLAYPIHTKDRKPIREFLEKNGVETRPLFNDETGFYIGCHQYLTQQDLDHIIEVFDRFVHS